MELEPFKSKITVSTSGALTMGQVTVRFLPPLAQVAGVEEETSGGTLTLDAQDGITVSQLLDALTNKFGNRLRDAVIDNKTSSLHSYVLILVNGSVSGLNARVNNGDDVAFAVTIGGG